MNCVCVTCIEKVSAPPTENTWLEDFQKDLLEGRIAHIGNTSDGRPIYRRTF